MAKTNLFKKILNKFKKNKIELEEEYKKKIKSYDKKVIYEFKNLNKIIPKLSDKELEDISNILKEIDELLRKSMPLFWTKLLRDLETNLNLVLTFIWTDPIVNLSSTKTWLIQNVLFTEKIWELLQEIENKILNEYKRWLVKEKVIENLNKYLKELVDEKNKTYQDEIISKYWIYYLLKHSKYSKKIKIINEISKKEIKLEKIKKDFEKFDGGFILVDKISKEYEIYLSSLSLKNLSELGAKTFAYNNFKLTNIFIVDNERNLNEISKFLSFLDKNDFRYLNKLKTTALKKYFLTTLTWSIKIGDFSCLLVTDERTWKTNYWFAEVWKWNWYAIIDTNLNRDDLLDDLRFLGVTLNWLTTLTDIEIVDSIRFRISVILTAERIAISIRKNWEWFIDKEIHKLFWFKDSDVLTEKDLKVYSVYDEWFNKNKEYDVEKWSAFFPIESFLNRKKDFKIIDFIIKSELGASIISWTTWHWKSSFLKTLAIKYFRYYLNKEKIRKKIIFLEAPIEHLFHDFYQIDYNVEYPEQLYKLVIATKTQNPQMAVIGETKDTNTFRQLYEMVWNTQAFTTMHLWNVAEIMKYIVDTAITTKQSPAWILKRNNILYAQQMRKDFIKDIRIDSRKNIEEYLTVLKWYKQLENYLKWQFLSKFIYNNKLSKKQNEINKKEIDETNKIIEEKIELILKETIQYKLNIYFDKILEKLNIKDNNNDNLVDKFKFITNTLDKNNLNKILEQIKQIIEDTKLKPLQTSYWEKGVKIVNEFITKKWIYDFIQNEWSSTTIEIAWEQKEIFNSLEDNFDINIFSASLDNLYKYIWIENTFEYKYFYYFMTWKFAFDSSIEEKLLSIKLLPVKAKLQLLEKFIFEVFEETNKDNILE